MKFFLTILLFYVMLSLYGQKSQFLPEQSLWEENIFDPLAAEIFGNIVEVQDKQGPVDYNLSNFSIGFNKAILIWDISTKSKLELGAEASIITQFKFTSREGIQRRNLFSTDYRVGLPLVLYKNPWSLRLRTFHLSSHLGDDHIIRNNINSYIKNNNNYEQIDLSFSYPYNAFVFNIGMGSILRASQTRKALYFSLGSTYTKAVKSRKNLHFIGGFFIDSRQEDSFEPAFNIGAGILIGEPNKRNIKLLLHYFEGPLPYSIYRGDFIRWFGLGCNIGI